jgi:hypothetical protein
MDDSRDADSKKPTNPRRIALLGAVATILSIINMSSGGEAPSQAVTILQYAALAGGVLALIGGLVMMATPQN